MPTPEQIEQTRDTLGVPSYASANAILSNAENSYSADEWTAIWAAQTSDTALFAAKRDKHTVLTGDVNINPADARRAIRVRSLQRFGFSGALDADGLPLIGAGGLPVAASASAVSFQSLKWY